MELWSLRGEGGANWKYLLPISEHCRVLCLSPISGEIMWSLARSVGQLTVICRTREGYLALEAFTHQRQLQNVKLCLLQTCNTPLNVGDHDIVVGCASSEEFKILLADPFGKGNDLKGIALIGKRRQKGCQKLLNGFRFTEYLPFPNCLNFLIIISMANRIVQQRSFKLHNTMKFKNRIGKGLATLLSSLGLLKQVFRNRLYVFTKVSGNEDSILLEYLRQQFRRDDICMALSPGSHGRGNKAIVQVMNSKGDVLGYAKIADNPFGQKYLENEWQMLTFLSNFQFTKGEVPAVIDFTRTNIHTILLLSGPKGSVRLSPTNLTSMHLDWLLELAKRTSSFKNNARHQFMEECCHNYTDVVTFCCFENQQSLKRLFDDALYIVSKASFGYSVTQRDFTPWNIRVTCDKIFVLDWEWGKQSYPPLFDMFHFGLQTRLRLTNMDSVRIANELFFRKGFYCNRLRWFCENLGIEHEVGFALFVLYVFNWMERGIEIGSPIIVDEQAALLNALITERAFRKNCFLGSQ